MNNTKKVLLLLANGFEIYEASVFIDVLGWNLVDGDGTTKLDICGFQKEIKSTFGVTVMADVIACEVDPDNYDAVAIPGGFSEYQFYDQAYSERFLALIRDFDKREKLIVSICTGGLPVGKSGVLRGRKGTTYNMKGGIRQRAMEEFGVTVLNQPIVVDKNIVTSWNPSTALDVAFILLERLTSSAQANHIRELMGSNPIEHGV